MICGRLRRGALAVTLAWTAMSGAALAETYLTVDGGRGPVKVYYPSAYDPAEPLPLIMALHGYTSDSDTCEARFQLQQHVDTRRFIYLCPDGTTNSQGWQFWNGTDVCCDYEGSGVDDSAYLQTLITQVRGLLNVDPRRITSIGYSNGGFMSHRLACEAPETFASIVSFAGLNWQDPAACPADQPVHVLQIHGTDDGIIPFSMGPNLGAESSARHWAEVARCDEDPDTSLSNIDLNPSISGSETTRARWEGCNPSGSAELWTIWGGQHEFDFVPNFSELLLDWIEAHPKEVMATSYCQAGSNSLASEGAKIHFDGYPSFSASELQLRASLVPQGQFGIFFAGVNREDPPISFG
ncbi:MAG: alpha/beta hydrolase-fold protein, partial [Planctomycetes bacterium]|nr:alpha/beta hydrolase-fold protein [Planctomycetota bacterium]